MNDYQTWFSEKWAKSGQAILGQSRPQNRPCLIFFYLVDLICLNLHIEEWTKNSPDLNCRGGGLWGHIFTVLEIFPPPPPPFCYDLCFFFKSINWQNPLPSLIGSQPQLGTIWQQVVAWLLKFKSGSLEGFWPQNEVSYFFPVRSVRFVWFCMVWYLASSSNILLENCLLAQKSLLSYIWAQKRCLMTRVRIWPYWCWLVQLV